MIEADATDGGRPSPVRGLYQLEVKLHLVTLAFPPSAGWKVTVDVDAMERARGGSHPSDKSHRAEAALEGLRSLGVTIGEHDQFGRADVVAEHPERGLRILEVEGDSGRQPDQCMYSALGQLLLNWRGSGKHLRYGIAVPETRRWRRQLAKIPIPARRAFGLELYLVGDARVVTFDIEERIPL